MTWSKQTSTLAPDKAEVPSYPECKKRKLQSPRILTSISGALDLTPVDPFLAPTPIS